jgi:hypothetical protein
MLLVPSYLEYYYGNFIAVEHMYFNRRDYYEECLSFLFTTVIAGFLCISEKIHLNKHLIHQKNMLEIDEELH